MVNNRTNNNNQTATTASCRESESATKPFLVRRVRTRAHPKFMDDGYDDEASPKRERA